MKKSFRRALQYTSMLALVASIATLRAPACACAPPALAPPQVDLTMPDKMRLASLDSRSHATRPVPRRQPM